jgi:hypothetical protein
MTENNQDQRQAQTNPYKPVEYNPNDTEFGIENPALGNQLVNFDENNEPEQKAKVAHETKGAKQTNGNDHANQFTQGRNDDRGRKAKDDNMEKKSADPHEADEARQSQGQPNNGQGVGYTDDDRTGGK